MSTPTSDVKPKMPRPAWQRVIGFFLSFVSLLYLLHLVVPDLSSFAGTFSGQTPVSLAAAISVALLMFAMKAVYHAVLCQRLSAKHKLLADVIPAYAVAQMVRYLPGKIWGIVYQSNRLSTQLHPSLIVAANTFQTLVTNLLGAGVILSVLGAAYIGSWWPLTGIFFSVVLTELIHRYPQPQAWLLRAVFWLVRRHTDLPKIPSQRISGTLMLLGEWVAYYFMWAVIVGETLPLLSTLTLATWYAAASLIAIFAFVVPAGIAVREAVFVSLATAPSSSPGELIGYAALVRVVLTIAELMLIPLAHISGNILRRRGGQSA